jgi:broad specificity phosphatase PhoE
MDGVSPRRIDDEEKPLRAYLLALVLYLTLAPNPAVAQGRHSAAVQDPTTIVIVRHAERADDHPTDPTLTPAGELRARALVDVVADADVAAIFSTPRRRNLATAAPLAESRGIPILVHDLASGEAEAHAAGLARDILADFRGRTVVVIGHSNTVPQIVRVLSGREVGEIGDHEYQNVFVVVVPAGGAPQLFRTRFGDADPS